ncbi:DUF308 domain-containing protein [Actinoplanes derwentensis]|uniref:DUF308 domain-containing protein n=1 Tax=Actinoplanes derwentensis TaxID=113562 RepID=A0A1H2C1V5_9ACTN|nr:DUF308 domain-containing protein [Actinoplanes derwentensis]GID84690.1 hypothetical protein Ade03nite_36140 [Actinoplanes derwentensis]SDT64302.1 hypothetical protein SAMN04489716_5128 [Actinoplanes derwentensis]
MTAGGARRGRRDNGLDAADFAAAGDVDPRIGEHLLDVLAAGGIAAYLQPTADLNPILRATTLPARPIDRLFVDRAHLETAKDHLQKVTGGIPPTPPAVPAPAPKPQAEVDEEWARIIAGFHTTVEAGKPPWPAAEDGSRQEEPRPVTEENPAHNRRRGDPKEEPSILYGLDTFGTDLPAEDDEDERYVPPPPPPLPHFSKYAVIGVLSIVVGFLLFLFPEVLPIDSFTVAVLGFAAIVGGAVTLVWRLRSGDDDDEFDDGAVV